MSNSALTRARKKLYGTSTEQAPTAPIGESGQTPAAPSASGSALARARKKLYGGQSVGAVPKQNNTYFKQGAIKGNADWLTVLENIGSAFARSQWYQNGGDYNIQASQAFESGLAPQAAIRDDPLRKTVAGTTADVAKNAAIGTGNAIERVWDGLLMLGSAYQQGQYYQNGGGYNLAVDRAAQQGFDATRAAVENTVKKDTIPEKDWGDAVGNTVGKEWLDADPEKDSVLGDKSDALVQSGADMAVRAALSKLSPGLGYMTSFAGVLGGEAENALNSGATYDEAMASGTIAATAEVLTEQISGAFKIGGKTLDEGLTNQLSRRISNRFVRNGLKLGFGALGEGFEEVISDGAGKFGQWLTYRDDESLQEMLFSEEALNDAIDSFWAGTILGGAFGGINLAVSEMQGKDYATGLSKENEQLLRDTYAQNLRRAEGVGAVTTAEKQKLYDSILDVLQEGEANGVAPNIDPAVLPQTRAQRAQEIRRGVTESATAAGVETEVSETVSAAAVKLDQTVVFAAQDSALVQTERAGSYDPTTDTVTLNPRVSQEAMLGYTIAHEMTHSAEGTRQLTALEKAVQRMVGAETWNRLQAETRQRYAADGIRLTEQQVRQETLADWVGNNLFKDGFAQAVVDGSATSGNAFIRVLDRVRRAVSIKNNPSARNIAMLERLFMEAVENKKGARKGDVEYALNADFANQYDQWDGKDPRTTFIVGTTSDVLQSLGLSEKAITWDAAKIIKIKSKHPEMTDDIIKKVPEILENPIIVMESRQTSSRWTMFGELYSNTNPVLVILELNPKGKKGIELDELKIVSSYPKDNAQNFVDNSSVLYVTNNKKRISNWEKRTGLQLPVGLSITNPNTTVAQNTAGVNTQSMQGGGEYSQNALLGKEYFTGDAMTPEARARWMGTPSVADGDTSLGEGGYGADAATAPMGDVQVVERALQLTAEGKRKATAADFDGILQELGEEETLKRLYNSQQFDRPTGMVEIEGRRVDANAYVDAYEQSLPNDPAALQETIRHLEKQHTAEVLKMEQEGTLKNYKPHRLKIDLQLFAAKRKMELLQLEPGEDGSKVRQFWEKRLKGNDEMHSEELLELMAGRTETYDPISNQETLNKARDKLLNIDYHNKLLKQLGKRSSARRLTEVDVAAAIELTRKAYNDGDYEGMMDLIAGLSRRGTELGRAVQAFSMMARMTPEGVLKAAHRTLKAEADYIIGEGASEGLDALADKLSKALEQLNRLKGSEIQSPRPDGAPPFTQGGHAADAATQAVEDADIRVAEEEGNGQKVTVQVTRENVVGALAADLAATEGTYLTRADIEKNLEKVIREATDVPEQVKRYVLKRLRKNDGGLAQRLYELHQRGHLNADATRRAMEQALELPTLTNEDVQTLVDMTTRVQELAEDPVAQANAMEEIYDFLGAKMAVNGMDRLQSWRKFAMLANVKTHVRNVVSNGAYAGVRKADELVAMGLEKLFRVKPEERTAYLGWSHTEHGQSIRPTLEKQAELAALEMQRRGAKYETGTGQLKSRRKFYGTSRIGEWLNKINKKNSDLLEWEDLLCFKPTYIDVLGQMMTAQGATEVTPQLHEKAMQRALEATFRADNAISDVLASLKRYQNSSKTGMRLFGQAVDVVIPFSKTPANIAVQTVMHSPVGVVKGAFDLYNAVKGKGSKDAATAINTMAKGITGSALMAVGLMLGSAGLFNTGFGKSEKERAADELAGRQENAIIIGDTSITLDWLQPTAAPLIVGASMGQRIREEGMNLGTVFGAVMDGTDSLFELSMLQSLYDILGGYDAGASATAASVAENVVSQSIPTLVGQAARSIDPVQRKTKGDSDFETIVNQVLAKIPGLTYLLDPELDVWGNEVYRTGKPSGGNAALNAAQQFALPWNTKTGTGAGDYVSEEILRLYEEYGNEVIPTAISRDDARDKGLNYVEDNRTLGAVNRTAVEDFINDVWPYQVQETLPNGKTRTVTKFYSEMTDDERRRVLSRIYQKSKETVTGDTEDTKTKSKQDRYFEQLFEEMR